MFGGPLTKPAGFLPGEERWDKEFCGNENNLRKENRKANGHFDDDDEKLNQPKNLSKYHIHNDDLKPSTNREEIHRKSNKSKTIGSVNLSNNHALLINNLPPPQQPIHRNGSVEKTGSINRRGSHSSHANLTTSQANGTGSSEREGPTSGKSSHFRHANLIISHASDIVKPENYQKKIKETTNRKGSDLRHANLIISHPSDNVTPEDYEKKTKITQETKTEFLLSGSPLDIDSMKTNLSDFIYKFINPDITGIQEENKDKKKKWIEPLDRFFVKSFINQFITPGSLKVIRRQNGNEKGGKNATEAFKSKLNKFISQFIRPPSTLKRENNEVPSVRKSVEAKVDKFFTQLISPTLTFNQSTKDPNKSDQKKTKTKTTTFIDELVEEYDLMNELLKANNDLEERQRVQML